MRSVSIRWTQKNRWEPGSYRPSIIHVKEVKHMTKQVEKTEAEKLVENLEVIEAKELEVGSAFHAFRFNTLDTEK
ncbi:hypothetical protein SAMN05444672_11946 [Bacillus sp. OK838]|nr:hypothetical protein SAMN05444672_11946 [Bacillus sp. OK838]